MAASGSIRAVVNRGKRLWFSIFLVGLLFFAATPLFGVQNGPPWLAFVGMGLAMIAVVGINLLIRCPRCKGNLGVIAGVSGHPFAISGKVRYCPYCAADFDAPN
jgi:O-antigen ligase